MYTWMHKYTKDIDMRILDVCTCAEYFCTRAYTYAFICTVPNYPYIRVFFF